MANTQRLLSEWQPQEAIILAWPDESTDWAPWLSEVRSTYVALIQAITNHQTGVILLVKKSQIEIAQRYLADCQHVLLVPAEYNDTWCRDYAFLTCEVEGKKVPVEFTFNGWGNKFDASKDNLVNKNVLAPLCKQPLQTSKLVCEGGALEIDDNGELLSTQFCLLNPERNGRFSLEQYQTLFSDFLGAKNSTFLVNGHLEGDDTDGHIDTLVRFTDDMGIVIQSAFNRSNDSHFEGLNKLVAECKQHFPEHTIFELPLPHINNQEQHRLPASYANYLINNQIILFPVYQQEEDALALDVIAKAYPQHRIVAIDSLPLVQQFGSIHCISMQVPVGTLQDSVVSRLNQGVSVYEH